MGKAHYNIAISVGWVYIVAMFIPRYLNLTDFVTPGKVVVLYGPRRVGKTTLLQQLVQQTSQKTLFLRGDDLSVQQNFEKPIERVLKGVIGDHKLVIIDEAQDIPNIGASLKLLVDSMPDVAVVVSGSSSFDLANQIGEPLVGRKITKYLMPISISEIAKSGLTNNQIKQNLDTYLVYGMYPESLTSTDLNSKEQFIQELLNGQLLRDILKFQDVKSSAILTQLLSLLAYQVGSLVSYSELASKLQIDRSTVLRYLDLLEKSYIIYRLGGYSGNLRKEITSKAKYYFYDIGVRNGLIGAFNNPAYRLDLGAVWENFMITERYKKRLYDGPKVNQYFWRTWEGGEVDLIEERGGKLRGIEFKWGTKKSPKAPPSWIKSYPDTATWEYINPDNFLENDFI